MTLSAYLLVALVSWLRIPAPDAPRAALATWQAIYGEPAASTRARAAQIAERLESVAGDDGGRALELAAVAVLETHLEPWAVGSACHEVRWRAAHPRPDDCDGGRAWGPWQIHPSAAVDRLEGHHADGQEIARDTNLAWLLYWQHPSAWSTHRRAVRMARAWLVGHPWRAP